MLLITACLGADLVGGRCSATPYKEVVWNNAFAVRGEKENSPSKCRIHDAALQIHENTDKGILRKPKQPDHLFLQGFGQEVEKSHESFSTLCAREDRAPRGPCRASPSTETCGGRAFPSCPVPSRQVLATWGSQGSRPPVYCASSLSHGCWGWGTAPAASLCSCSPAQQPSAQR